MYPNATRWRRPVVIAVVYTVSGHPDDMWSSCAGKENLSPASPPSHKPQAIGSILGTRPQICWEPTKGRFQLREEEISKNFHVQRDVIEKKWGVFLFLFSLQLDLL